MAYGRSFDHVPAADRVLCSFAHKRPQHCCCLPDTAQRTLRRECSRSSRRRRSRKFFNVPSEQLDSLRCLEEFSVPDPRRGISRPLSAPGNPTSALANRSAGYAKTDSGILRNAGFMDPSYKIPGGGWLSTAGDMVRFGLALQAGTLLKPNNFQQMTTMQRVDGKGDTFYGLGWIVEGWGMPDAPRVPGLRVARRRTTRSHDEPIHALSRSDCRRADDQSRGRGAISHATGVGDHEHRAWPLKLAKALFDDEDAAHRPASSAACGVRSRAAERWRGGAPAAGAASHGSAHRTPPATEKVPRS
jgi:beta-lactamase family protein